MEQLKGQRVITVRHPLHGETIIAGKIDKMDAAIEAAHRWKMQWSVLAKEGSFWEKGVRI